MLAAPGEASAGEVYIGGTSLRLRASQQSTERRSFAFRSAADPSIGPPFPDPTAGASLLVFASNAAGECRAEIPLDPAGWTENRGDGPNYGYRYDGDPATDQGIKRIRLIRRKNGGRVAVRARGGGWPCGLEATAQSTPVAVALRVDDVRYCAEFGAGTVTRNQTGGLRARNAPAPAACPDDDLTVANLNLLHGLGCPDSCRGADRVALLYQWIAGSGCPDVVTLQEILPALLPFIQAQNLTVCPFPYEILYEQTNPFDNELVLSRYPILASEVRPLWLGFRRVTWARLDHPIGPVDVFTTHLASGSDGGPSPCGASCPAECVTAGAVTNRDCQAVQMALLVEEKHDVDAPGAITGDFNDEPGTFVYDQFRDRGWPDTYLAVGNPECAPLTGVGCTSGRATSLAEIESTAANVDERIDYTFLIPPGPASTCVAALDAASDDDGDGSATRIFADDPNPFSPSCGAAPDPVCWPSDHEGSEMDLNCG
jgi:endonuclease/exonuclease/phosphatase family metal-dependent hydrolase